MPLKSLTRQRSLGFTIVELLIVIVVIAILATISVVAYNGIQDRSRDSKRASDFAQIKKALVAYDILNGGVRSVSQYNSDGATYHSGWDSSSDPNWLLFLRDSNGMMPVDPVNTMGTNLNPTQPNNLVYFYYCYPQGAGPSPDTPNVRVGYHNSKGALISDVFAVTRCF